MRKNQKNRRRQSQRRLMGPPVTAKPVDECETLHEIFMNCLPAFGGAYLRRVYTIVHQAIRQNIPLVIAIAGPVTVSDQHRGWLIPLIKRGWVAYLTVTDAICYHDGHDSLEKFKERPIREVDMWGDDAEHLKAGIIRVTNTGFDDELLFKQDPMVSAVQQRPEVQHKMTTTERNYLLGKYYAKQEETFGVRSGLLSTCAEYGVPIFVGAPADGSIFLNSVKIWALQQLGEKRFLSYAFEYDLHKDVFESCAYHYWGLFDSAPKALAILILGGGVPKNYALQPEPTLSQIFLLPNIRGYDYDAQIVSAPVTDGSLSSAPPAEAVSWGKINPETYKEATESMQGDYSTYMPFIAKSLCDMLPAREQLRLYERRDELIGNLFDAIRKRKRKS